MYKRLQTHSHTFSTCRTSSYGNYERDPVIFCPPNLIDQNKIGHDKFEPVPPLH